MKNISILLISIASIFIFGCGHNILTDYKVNGIDLSIPIGGYPFGIRIGHVEVNANMLRGNASYSAHNNVGTKMADGSIQNSGVIEFSSNSQINEGNVKKILTSNKVDPLTKQTFVKEYLKVQEAPKVNPVSSKTNMSGSVSGDDKSMHKNLNIKESKGNIFSNLFKGSVFSIIASKVGQFFVISAAGKAILNILKIVCLIIVLLFVIDILKKVFGFLYRIIFKKKDQN